TSDLGYLLRGSCLVQPVRARRYVPGGTVKSRADARLGQIPIRLTCPPNTLRPEPCMTGHHPPARFVLLILFLELIALCLLSITANTQAATNVGEANHYWPEWRGPLAIGVAPGAHPPLQWSEGKNVKWKVAVPGGGSSTPIVWKDQIFIQTAIATGRKPAAGGEANDPEAAPPSPAPQDGAAPTRPGRGGPGGRGSKPDDMYQFVLLCLDRASGQELWRSVLREEVPHEGIFVGNGTFASSSPVTDGQRVYAFFGSRGLYCLDMEGHKLWDKDLGRMQIRLSF